MYGDTVKRSVPRRAPLEGVGSSEVPTLGAITPRRYRCPIAAFVRPRPPVHARAFVAARAVPRLRV